MYFRYVAPHCNSVEKDTTTKARKKDLKEKAKVRRPVKLMTWSSKSEVEPEIKEKAVPHPSRDLNQRQNALMGLKGTSGCKNVCQPEQTSWKCMLQEAGHTPYTWSLQQWPTGVLQRTWHATGHLVEHHLLTVWWKKGEFWKTRIYRTQKLKKMLTPDHICQSWRFFTCSFWAATISSFYCNLIVREALTPGQSWVSTSTLHIKG